MSQDRLSQASPIRVLLDACVAPSVATRLRKTGADVLHMLEIDATMEDPDVIALARRDDRLLVTSDRKLSSFVFVDGIPHGGILIVREPRLTLSECGALIVEVMLDRYGELVSNFSTLQNGRLRIHRRNEPR